jgi:hypothetical protein
VNDEDLRDCFAMFALMGYIVKRDIDPHMFETCYNIADAMLKARKAKNETGIVAVKRSSTTRRSK